MFGSVRELLLSGGSLTVNEGDGRLGDSVNRVGRDSAISTVDETFASTILLDSAEIPPSEILPALTRRLKQCVNLPLRQPSLASTFPCVNIPLLVAQMCTRWCFYLELINNPDVHPDSRAHTPERPAVPTCAATHFANISSL
jgi:hypothetical protein